MLFYSPCVIRPLQVKALTRLFGRWRPVPIQFPRPITVAPSRCLQSTAWETLRNGRLSGLQAIHTVSTLASTPDEKAASSGRVDDLALQLSQRPMNGNAYMQYTLYNSNGAAAPGNRLTKLEIADRYELSTRDLRIFDLPSSGFPHILVRENTILIHLFDLRLLVQSDQVLLFHIAEYPGHGHEDEHTVSRVFTHNLEEKLRSHHELGLSVGQPFELRVVEATLASVTSVLEAEYILAERQVSNALRMTDQDTLDWEESLIQTKLRMALDLTRKLAVIEQRARQVRNVAQEVLNEDEDMANMHLTDKKAGKPHALQDHQDVEYLFEAYFKASDAVAEEAAILMDNIRRTEETIQSTLSVRRNQIMVLEAQMEIFMLALACPTLLAGWYGMNVINYLEESAFAFAALVSLSFAGITSISWYGMRRLRHIRRLRL